MHRRKEKLADQKLANSRPSRRNNCACSAASSIIGGSGQPEAALAEVEKESDPGYRTHARARSYILVGRSADADAALAEVEKTFAADWAY